MKCIRDDCENKISLYCISHSIAVEKRCERARKQGALEVLREVVDSFFPREYAKEKIKELESGLL